MHRAPKEFQGTAELRGSATHDALLAAVELARGLDGVRDRASDAALAPAAAGEAVVRAA